MLYQINVMYYRNYVSCLQMFLLIYLELINRFCVDFWKLNNIIVFDLEFMLNFESIFVKMVGKKFVLKIDFSKGYW